VNINEELTRFNPPVFEEVKRPTPEDAVASTPLGHYSRPLSISAQVLLVILALMLRLT